MPDIRPPNGNDDLKSLRDQFEQLPQAEPSAELDQKVLAMAKAALKESKSQSKGNLLREHSGLITAAAAAVFAVGIVFTLSDPTREVSPSRLPAERPMQIELAEPEETLGVRERRPAMKAQSPSRPSAPPVYNSEPDTEEMAAQPEQAAAPVLDLSAKPDASLAEPQPPKLDQRQDDGTARTERIILPMSERPASAERTRAMVPEPNVAPDERLRRRAPDPGDSPGIEHDPGDSPGIEHDPGDSPGIEHDPGDSPGIEHDPGDSPGIEHDPGDSPGIEYDPGAAPASSSLPPATVLERIILEQGDNATQGQSLPEGSARKEEQPSEAKLASESWDSLIERARAARSAGDEAEVNRILAYLSQHFADRPLPSDLRPKPGESGNP